MPHGPRKLLCARRNGPYTVWMGRNTEESSPFYHGTTYATEPCDFSRLWLMRFAVISDVHGNVEALRAVLRAIRRDGIRKVICLGDMVGFHAFPVETLTLIRAGGTLCLAGNHDLIASGRLNREGDLRTRRALGWTRRKLRPEDSSFLAALPAELQFSDALCLHATLDDPSVELLE